MPISTVYDKISRMQKEETIKRYTTLVDFTKLGFNHRMLLFLKISPEESDKALSYFKDCSCINTLHEINYGFNFCLETIHKDIKEYLNFLRELKLKLKVYEIQEYQIVLEINNNRFMN